MIFLTVAVAFWTVVSAGEPTTAGEIAGSSTRSRSSQDVILINSDPFGRGGATGPVGVENIFSTVTRKATDAESSTVASSKRRKIYHDYRAPPQSPRHTQKNYSPRHKLEPGSEKSPMEVDDIMQPREKNRKRPQAPEEEARAGAEELQRGLRFAFGGNNQILSEIEDSGIFKVPRRLLNLLTYHDLSDDKIEGDDADILDNAFNDLPSDLDLSERQIFWEYLDQGNKPEIAEYKAQGLPLGDLAIELQSHENMINLKLLEILVHGRSHTLHPNAKRALEISKLYHQFLDKVEKELTGKPNSYIKQLSEYKGNLGP
ncbi:hypothetical protein PTTG_28947 [Puccinia triticina 1-1 BBBD Race 1]|uniref:Uncharacterized protein n=2 Tax=Puccinia triticina TaxID=208348 RepID=A0A180G9V1_PUCT1|nr:uncharacterized protein PtA15_6A468 [Puccinia triticina]OAV88693.1 hypothetical protein PTTG_28947 [Puccinia triticina 1-1 BBBD Race 1]WAQ85839.1 hypothetical protein PtA15_6A468 [Puccinia triticina]WAR55725.1 hypothetical protein PtB15_6B468 [Puccinia triticina]